ncbi:MAG: hypothetical protein HDT50_02975 [Lactobacillus sp.]|nr:hypothetical protein [Lactobacillus sp.]
MRKEQKYRLHFENTDDEVFFTLLVSEKNDCLVDKFGNAEILSKLRDRCTENEKKYLRICLNHDLSITEIAKCLKVSRKTVYNYRSKILIKYENLSD